MSFTIGIDVGGTFTDIVVASPDGRTVIAKATTTPADQSGGVLDGVALAARQLGLTTEALLAETSRIVHGTTVATNALLEGKTAPVGLLTTEGHRDVIEMREGLKPERYNLRMAPHRRRWCRVAFVCRFRSACAPMDRWRLRSINVVGLGHRSAEGGKRRGRRDLLPARMARPRARTTRRRSRSRALQMRM